MVAQEFQPFTTTGSQVQNRPVRQFLPLRLRDNSGKYFVAALSLRAVRERRSQMRNTARLFRAALKPPAGPASRCRMPLPVGDEHQLGARPRARSEAQLPLAFVLRSAAWPTVCICNRFISSMALVNLSSQSLPALSFPGPIPRETRPTEFFELRSDNAKSFRDGGQFAQEALLNNPPRQCFSLQLCLKPRDRMGR